MGLIFSIVMKQYTALAITLFSLQAVFSQTDTPAPPGAACERDVVQCDDQSTCNYINSETSGYCTNCDQIAAVASNCNEYFQGSPNCDDRCIQECALKCNYAFSTPNPDLTTFTPTQPYGNTFKGWQRKAIYIEYNFDWANFDQELINAMNAGYNYIYLGFYMSRWGCTAACTAWQGFTDAQRNTVKQTLYGKAQLYLSVGGPGEFAEGVMRDGTTEQFAQSAAKFARQYDFDGLDFAVSLAGEGTVASQWASNGSFVGYVKTFIEAAKTQPSPVYSAFSLAVSCQAPYFAPQFLGTTTPAGKNQEFSLSYLTLNSNSGQPYFIGSINLMMFNEGQNYMTETDIFVQNTFSDPYYGIFGAGSSVQELANLGIEPARITVMKPVAQEVDQVRSGYVSPANLGQWGCDAWDSFQWSGGWLAWNWGSYDGQSVLTWLEDIQAGTQSSTLAGGCIDPRIN